MPILADKISTAARGLGILMGATGVGAPLRALTLAAKTGVKGLGRWVAFACAASASACVFFRSRHFFWLSARTPDAAGYSMMLQMACSNNLGPDHGSRQLRGRVMSVYSMMFMGMAPIGAFFGGALAHRLGAPFTVAVGGVPASWEQSGSAARFPNCASKPAA